jgi:hypothetical protein
MMPRKRQDECLLTCREQRKGPLGVPMRRLGRQLGDIRRAQEGLSDAAPSAQERQSTETLAGVRVGQIGRFLQSPASVDFLADDTLLLHPTH